MPTLWKNEKRCTNYKLANNSFVISFMRFESVYDFVRFEMAYTQRVGWGEREKKNVPANAGNKD